MSEDEREDVSGVVGAQVYSVSLKNGIHLGMKAGAVESWLEIESAFDFTDSSGVAFRVTPLPYVPLDPNVAHVGTLLGAMVTDIDVRQSGTLAIEFSTGAAVFVEPGEREAWHLHDSSGRGTLHAMPGGGLG